FYRNAGGNAGSLDLTLPLQLNIARFLLPAVALFESYSLVLGAIRSPARLAMLGLRRGHIVVVPGRGPTGFALMHEVRTSGLRAVAVAPDLRVDDRMRIEEYRLAGLVVLPADPFLEATWHQARADRADLVVVSHGSDVENLNIVVTVADALRRRRSGGGPMLVTALDNELLAEQVDVALDKAARSSGLRYRRLSVPDEAARMIFLDPPLPTRKRDRTEPSHIIVLGLGAGARAVLRHALTLGQDAASAGPRISVLAADKELAAEPLLQPDTIPGFVAELRGISCDWSFGLPQSALDTLLREAPAPVLACVCLADDAAVAAGIALARQATLQGWPDFAIAVHQQREDRFLNLLARENTGAGHARLRPFGGLLPPGTLQRLRDERHDRLPRAVHAHYLETLRRLNTTDGTPVRWDDLSENARHANRAAADHIAVKLAAIGCRIVAGDASSFAFTEAELDALARIEHRRWCAERLLRGWRLGERDNDKRLHPDLVPFEALTEEAQEKDRGAVSALSEVLALAGLSIQRGTPVTADAATRAEAAAGQRAPSAAAV
ncbi:MAG: RyR domain-containing protein, partial [Nevskiales bacterium]